MVYKLISPTESQVGKYIDTNGDGIPEGIIFIDLVADKEKQLKYDNKMYKIPTIKEKDNIKEYVTGGKFSHKLNGEQEMLMPIFDGEDRFYIMALEDVDKHWCHHWYANVSDMKDFAITTAMDFGSGQKNTLNIIEKWNKEDYGAQDSFDIWNIIKKQVEDGWFVPSIREWCAFAEELHINLGRETADSYWSSSQRDKITSFGIDFKVGDFFITTTDVPYSIRLAKTI